MATFVRKSFSLVNRGVDTYTPIVTYINALETGQKLVADFGKHQEEPVLTLVHTDTTSGTALNAKILSGDTRATMEAGLDAHLLTIADSRTVLFIKAMTVPNTKMAILVVDHA